MNGWLNQTKPNQTKPKNQNRMIDAENMGTVDPVETVEKELKAWSLSLAVADGDAAVRVNWNQMGLELPEGTSREELRGLLRAFRAFTTAGEIALADVVSFARRKGWLEELELELTELEYDPATVRKALQIADVPSGLRHPYLCSEHYCVVSELAYPEMVRWLKLAVERKMSPFLLKRSIEQGRPLTKEELEQMSGAGSGIPNYLGILGGWNRWKKKVGGDDAILGWPKHVLERWVEEVSPIADLVDKAKQKLNE
jgi:hypothetical protein